jgi:tetratricopeptide (TPR) repeat protein
MLHRRLVVGVAGGVLGVLCVCGVAAAQNGRVSGIVREEGGQPLKGATVTADNPSIGQSFTSTTDDKGRFSMIGLRGGLWRFIAQAPGFAPEAGAMNVRIGAPNVPLAFELKHSGVAFFGALGGVVNKDLQTDLATAESFFAQERWDDAIAAYRVILNRVPVLTAINLQIAAAYRHKKDYGAAMAAYADILKAEPGNDKAKIELAMTALEKGDRQTAEQTLLRAASEPDAPREVFYTLGEVKLTDNDADGAATWFEKAAAADPFWAKPLLQLGEAALKKGDNAGAARLLARAVEVDPTAPEAATAKTVLESLNK